jgi:hypothetical protein
MKAGTITFELKLVDHLSPALRRLAWWLRSCDGQWHPGYMVADGLVQTSTVRR